MQFRTEVEIKKSQLTISHKSKLMMIGSCFAENIGGRLKELKFNIDVNPVGIVFNPISVAQTLDRLIEGRFYSAQELFYANECWNSFDHHSRFSNLSKDVALDNINSEFAASSEMLKNIDFLIITFGTSWIYHHIEKDITVANCHKLPSKTFERKLISVTDITTRFFELEDKLSKINPEIRIIYTVSPVRHLKDGATGNQISKSILRLAVDELTKSNIAEYFPAYEIMLDELRDYRFYNHDMVHPSEMAIEYIFEKFANAYFTDETSRLNKEIAEIARACQHRPVNPQSKAHQKFQKQILEKIEKIESSNSNLNFSEEKQLLKKIFCC